MYDILYNKREMYLGAYLQSTDFFIIIVISNTRGFGVFLTKYTYNNYIYIYYIYYIQHLYIYLLKMHPIPEN